MVQKIGFNDLQPETWDLFQVGLQNLFKYKNAVDNYITKLKTRQRETKRQDDALFTLKHGSWAEIVGGGVTLQGVGYKTPQTTAGTGGQASDKLDSLKLRQITLKIGSDEEWAKVKTLTQTDLVRSFQNQTNKATKELVAAYTKDNL